MDSARALEPILVRRALSDRTPPMAFARSAHKSGDRHEIDRTAEVYGRPRRPLEGIFTAEGRGKVTTRRYARPSAMGRKTRRLARRAVLDQASWTTLLGPFSPLGPSFTVPGSLGPGASFGAPAGRPSPSASSLRSRRALRATSFAHGSCIERWFVTPSKPRGDAVGRSTLLCRATGHGAQDHTYRCDVPNDTAPATHGGNTTGVRQVGDAVTSSATVQPG